MENISIDTVQTYIMTYGFQVLGAIAILLVGKWLAKLATKLIRRSLKRANVDDTLVAFIENIAYGLALAFVVIAALSNLGVETTSIAAIFAAAGLAIGLALQGSLSNFASGVLIILFRPFKNGDYVEAGGTSGTVEEISIFTTRMKTPDNKAVIVPNGNITSNTITNYSANDTRRIDFVFGVGYADNLKHAKKVIHEVLEKESRILKDPAPTVGVLELADSSVNFAVRPWVKTSDYWGVYFDVMQEIKERFDEEGLTIPFPQQDVYMHPIDTKAKKHAAA